MRLAYLDTTFGALPFSARRGAQETLVATGMNLGNLAIWQGARQLVDEEVFSFGWHSDPQDVRRRADAVIVPAANWLGDHADLGELGAIIEAIDRPTVVVGLGAQAASGTRPQTIHPSALAFVHACARRTPRLLLRGETTRAVCAGLGIHNTAATGCPSLFIEPDPQLGRLLASRWPPRPGRTVFHTLELRPEMLETERHLMRLAGAIDGSAFVVQAHAELIELLLPGTDPASPRALAIGQGLGRALLPDRAPAEAIAWLRAHGYFFDSVDAWRRFLRHFGAAVNTRIHGSLMAAYAGVPSVCLHHDSRTQELAATMGLPALPHQQVAQARMGVADIFAAVHFDGQAFDANRRERARVCVEVLRECGIRPSQTLLGLAGTEAQVGSATALA